MKPGGMPDVDLDSYREQGHLLVKGVFAPDEVRDLRERIEMIR